MMKALDIGVDIDNVLVNTTECVLEWLAERCALTEVKDNA
jgi:hypothetical protein